MEVLLYGVVGLGVSLLAGIVNELSERRRLRRRPFGAVGAFGAGFGITPRQSTERGEGKPGGSPVDAPSKTVEMFEVEVELEEDLSGETRSVEQAETTTLPDASSDLEEDVLDLLDAELRSLAPEELVEFEDTPDVERGLFSEDVVVFDEDALVKRITRGVREEIRIENQRAFWLGAAQGFVFYLLGVGTTLLIS